MLAYYRFFQTISRKSHPKLFSTKNQSSTPQEVIDKCLLIRENLQTLSDKFKGPLEKSSQKNTILPFVFLLGNHSSGKSSFINYVLQRKVQTTGVAPTDDSFTIIVPGPADVDRDGPAFIGDPDMGFSGLKSFGPNLIHHTQLKIRGHVSIQDFMIVDTPGMIDSPATLTHLKKSRVVRQNSEDRGYDFEGVCRWYAERADVILLFFDPDKPGTTGETLSILTNSLVGLEHKLHIILNKADQFRKIHDFARAYGSLCWNLSKVIQRKDLPRIYTMCLPPSFHAVYPSTLANDSFGPGSQSSGGGDAPGSLGHGIIDLEAAREEVVSEVFNAPKRRVDNEVSRLADSAALLFMHCRILDDISTQYRYARIRYFSVISAGWIAALASPAGLVVLGLPLDIDLTVAAMCALGMGIVNFINNRRLTDLANRLATSDECDRIFRRLYSRQIAEQDEDTLALWSRVEIVMRHSLTAQDIKTISRLTREEFNVLETTIDKTIPDLRRLIGPTYNRLPSKSADK